MKLLALARCSYSAPAGEGEAVTTDDDGERRVDFVFSLNKVFPKPFNPNL